MSSPSSAPENSCRITLGQAQQVRPKVPLLRILQAAGAQGDTFTLKEVMHFLGQYIMARQLYDKREQHLVHCGGDALGELLGLQSFSVKDPSPVYEMLKRNLTAASVPTDAAQTLPTEPNAAQPLRDRPQEEGSDSGIAEGDGKTSVLGASGSKCEDQDSLENLGNNPRPSLELALDDWDVSGLPWWFLGNLRNNYNSRSNGSTDIQTNQDVDTAIVSDTTDDLWFLSERPSEPGNAGNRTEPEELPEGDPEVPEAAPLEELEDSQSLSDDTDTETPSQERWQCCKCRRFNSPGKRYCYRCWALRRDWYHDCPKLPHSLSLPCLDPTKTPQREKERGLDVPDCRRTISAPAGQPAHLFAENPKSCPDPGSSVESLDLALREKRDFPDPTNPEGTESPSDSVRTLLSPCFLCQLRPRDGNIVHGRTAHLVACFRCARMLKRKGSPCPVCRKEIRMVIRIFMG